MTRTTAGRRHGARRILTRPATALAVAALAALASLPAVAVAATTADTVTISGTITDGSGHGWPLYAEVSLYPAGQVALTTYTDPATGQYSITVPANTAYTLSAYPRYPGYLVPQIPIQAAATDLTENAQPTADQASCTAPGYQASGGGCAEVAGGLIVGRVSDANTGLGVNGATVSDGPLTTTTAATQGDTSLGGGFYWLFSPNAGPQALSASMTDYQTAATSATVTDDAVVRADTALAAGQLAITSAPVDASVPLGHTSTATITVANTGGAAATATVSVQHPGPAVDASGDRQITVPTAKAGQRHQRPAVVRIPGHYSPRANLPLATRRMMRGQRPAAGQAASSWTRLTGPTGYGVMDNGLVRDDSGHLYSVGGMTDNSVGSQVRMANGWTYDPVKAAWTPIAPLPVAVQSPMAAYADGKVYAIGGWIDHNATATTGVRIYDPAANTWSAGMDMPAGRAAAGVAVLNGQIYVVGGCTDYACDTSADAWVYDPGADAWQAIAPYPAPVADLSCGGIGTSVYCFGGTDSNGNGTAAGYAYQPATNTWKQVTSLPADLWAASSAVANGQLVVSGGVSGGAITNAGYAYDPGSDAWSPLPADDQVVYPAFRGAGACGFYRLGGEVSYGFPSDDFGLLPSWSQCGTPDVPWVTTQQEQITVPAHSSVNVTLTLDTTTLSQPGDVSAQVTLDPSGTPYAVTPSPITLDATPPAGWSQVTGTVTLKPCIGAAGPADHASVELGGWVGSAAVRTDANGHYSYWERWQGRTVPLLFAKNGYLIQQHTARIRPGGTATVNATLNPIRSCT